MVTYAIAVASLGEYRIAAIRLVQADLGGQLAIFAGVRPRDPAVRVATSRDLPMTELRNLWLPRGLLLQMLPWRAMAADVLVLDLNPRVMHGWLLLALRRLAGKRTVLWGHAFPRNGPGSRSARLRHLMRRMADGLIAYTRSDADALAGLHPGKPVTAAPNALYRRAAMRFEPCGRHTDIVFVGRLAAEKKPLLLLRAFERATPELGPECRLVMVGDGPLAGQLRSKAAASPVADRIVFPGHVADPERLAGIYADAVVAVSPGYAGLSVTQSLGFGVPMLIARDEPHAPEIEAAQEGENAAFFERDDVDALAAALVTFWRDRSVWRERGPQISARCAAAYSAEAMADGIVAALRAQRR